MPLMFALGVSLMVAYAIVKAVYNLYFHPLARFPGPIAWRTCRIPFAVGLLRRTLVRDIVSLHEKYGPIVRIAPNELAFTDPRAWRDIYTRRPEMAKCPVVYRTRGMPLSILNESEANHRIIRRELAYGFSDKGLAAQEPIISGYVDLLTRRLHEHCAERGGQEPQTVDLASWYNWTTFDIVGDLAFGECFQCLQRAAYDPWVAAINDTAQGAAFILAMKHLGLERVVSFLMKHVLRPRREHGKRTREKLLKRMAMDTERPDLIQGLLRKKGDWNSSIDRLQINASFLIVAGSETTAGLLCGATYLLLTNPTALAKLKHEVRAAFASDANITLAAVGRLAYLTACVNEALRYYPPIPMGLTRVVPAGGAMIAGTFVPEKTAVALWQCAVNNSKDNWTDPESFHPERFMGDARFEGDQLDALQPFSLGAHNCIGRNLAYTEVRLILARIMYNFDMSLEPGEQNWLQQKGFLFWQKPPLRVRLTAA